MSSSALDSVLSEAYCSIFSLSAQVKPVALFERFPSITIIFSSVVIVSLVAIASPFTLLTFLSSSSSFHLPPATLNVLHESQQIAASTFNFFPPQF